MGGDTDRLNSLAAELGVQSGAELDVLLASGEQASAALLAMALQQMGVEAASFCAHQVYIKTTCIHQQARIESVEPEGLQKALGQGITPVVTGFQGISENGRIMTLGRGGSDLTAVAVAAALSAGECQIYTDIDGVYSADPRIVANAQKIESIDLPLMTEYAQAGAGVLQSRCLDLASKESVSLRVLSSYASQDGTRLVPAKQVKEASCVIGIAKRSGYQLLQVQDLPERPGLLSYCLAAFKKIGLRYEMLQFSGESLLLSLNGRIDKPLLAEIDLLLKEFDGKAAYQVQAGLTKVTVVGLGLDAEQGVFLSVCSTLSKEGVDPYLLSFCSTRIEMLLPNFSAERVICALHEQLLA